MPAGYDSILAVLEPEPAEGPVCGGLHCAVGDNAACALDRFRLVCIDRVCTSGVWDLASAVGVGTLIEVSKRTMEETDDGEVSAISLCLADGGEQKWLRWQAGSCCW